jgi:hypothetical protein
VYNIQKVKNLIIAFLSMRYSIWTPKSTKHFRHIKKTWLDDDKEEDDVNDHGFGFPAFA